MYYQWPFVGIIAAVVAVLSVIAALFVRQISNDPKKKAQGDRALLKELLEGFGLEVPAELNEPEGTVIKTIETP